MGYVLLWRRLKMNNDAKRIEQILDSMSVGKIKYETKRAIQKGFKSLEEKIQYDINLLNKENTEWLESPQQLLKKLKQEVKTTANKTAKVDKEKLLWKQTIDGKPHFSAKYFLKRHNPNFNAKTMTGASKEMMEWFLKTIGHLNPLTIDRDGDWGDEEIPTYKYVDFLWCILSKKYVLDAKTTIKNVEVMDEENEPFEWFSDLEHLITNDKMFWTMAINMYVRKSSYFSYKTFSKYKRLEVPFSTRLECFQFWSEGKSSGEEKYRGTQFQKERYKSLPDDEWITIYRGFYVRKGKTVRKGVSKYTDDGHIHDEGSAYSYSFEKTVALRIYTHFNSHLVKKYTNMKTDDDARNIVKEWHPNIHSELETYYEGFYRCIGEFRVKKKDIIFATDYMHEEEVVINPSKVRLVDYRFINIIDIITFHSYQITLKRMFETTNVKNFNITRIVNIGGFHDYFHLVMKSYFKKNPDEVGNFIIKTASHLPTINKITQTFLTALKTDFGIKSNNNNSVDFGIYKRVIHGTELYEIVLVDRDKITNKDCVIYTFPSINDNSVRQKTSVPKSKMNEKSIFAEMNGMYETPNDLVSWTSDSDKLLLGHANLDSLKKYDIDLGYKP